MSLLPQTNTQASLPEREHPRLLQRPHSVAEQRARWEVRAAQWRAKELAEAVFGDVVGATLSGMRPDGIRGLLRLVVPFERLEVHRDREERFMVAAGMDPVLNRVPLVFVFAPSHG